MADRPPRACIDVLAGVDGAGKSSIAGESLRARAAEYFNPDEYTRSIRSADPRVSESAANEVAWLEGKRRLEESIRRRRDFVFETTLGGRTITRLLEEAL
ncbi:MAG TPA: zeta toxin family protein, partial [Planctomycetota bacterium]|nr:zeta toxin family protein [Planctomycetota bacterium]